MGTTGTGIRGGRNHHLHSSTIDRRSFLISSAAAAGAVLGPWVPRARADVGGTLELMAWEGCDLNQESAAWRAENNVTVRLSTIAAPDDVTAKLSGNNPVHLDVAEYSNGYNEIYDQLGVLTEINTSKIPNYNKDDIFAPFYQGDMWYWNGKQWAIPFLWGADQIIINPEMASVEVKGYPDLLDSSFTGKVAIIDNPLTVWPQLAKLTGYGDKFPLMTKEELADCFAKNRPYRDQVKIFATSNGDVISLLANREISAVFCAWAGIPLETAKQNVATKAILPADGGTFWVDAWFIPQTAENVDTALSFINLATGAEAQASAAMRLGNCPVNSKSVPLLDAGTKSFYDFDNFDKQFGKTKIYGQPPRVSTEFATYDDWILAWSDFKAGL